MDLIRRSGFAAATKDGLLFGKDADRALEKAAAAWEYHGVFPIPPAFVAYADAVLKADGFPFLEFAHCAARARSLSDLHTDNSSADTGDDSSTDSEVEKELGDCFSPVEHALAAMARDAPGPGPYCLPQWVKDFLGHHLAYLLAHPKRCDEGTRTGAVRLWLLLRRLDHPFAASLAPGLEASPESWRALFIGLEDFMLDEIRKSCRATSELSAHAGVPSPFPRALFDFLVELVANDRGGRKVAVLRLVDDLICAEWSKAGPVAPDVDLDQSHVELLTTTLARLDRMGEPKAKTLTAIGNLFVKTKRAAVGADLEDLLLGVLKGSAHKRSVVEKARACWVLTLCPAPFRQTVLRAAMAALPLLPANTFLTTIAASACETRTSADDAADLLMVFETAASMPEFHSEWLPYLPWLVTLAGTHPDSVVKALTNFAGSGGAAARTALAPYVSTLAGHGAFASIVRMIQQSASFPASKSRKRRRHQHAAE